MKSVFSHLHSFWVLKMETLRWLMMIMR